VLHQVLQPDHLSCVITTPWGQQYSKLAWPIDVGAVLDGHHVDAAALVIQLWRCLA
jgi:hypothetical protein